MDSNNTDSANGPQGSVVTPMPGSPPSPDAPLPPPARLTPFGRFVLGYALLFAAVEASFRYRENALQWVVLLLAPVWVGTLAASYRKLPWHSLRARLVSAALTLCLAMAPYVGARCGIMLRDSVFRSRLPEYEAAVRAVQAGETPSIFPRLAHHITQSQKQPQIFFVWGRGFPLRHTAFVYSPTDPRADNAFTRHWRRIRPLAPHWYFAKD